MVKPKLGMVRPWSLSKLQKVDKYNTDCFHGNRTISSRVAISHFLR